MTSHEACSYHSGMPLILSHPSMTATPPGGWQFVIPESLSPRLKGTKLSASTLGELRNQYAAILRNNDEKYDEEAFHTALCLQLPSGYCESCGDEGISWPEHEPLTAKKVLGFFLTMILWYRRGKRFVSPEEARRRYEICRACPKSTATPPPDMQKEGCESCGAGGSARKYLYELVKDRANLAGDDPVLYCTLCGCDLSVKCHFDIQSACWK